MSLGNRGQGGIISMSQKKSLEKREYGVNISNLKNIPLKPFYNDITKLLNCLNLKILFNLDFFSIDNILF